MLKIGYLWIVVQMGLIASSNNINYDPMIKLYRTDIVNNIRDTILKLILLLAKSS